MDSTWLLTKEAAAYLGMHPDTARDLMRRGDIRAVKRGKAWRTTKRWCDDYLTEGAAHAHHVASLTRAYERKTRNAHPDHT